MDLKLIKKELGLKIKLYRMQYNLTQEMFAEIVDIEQPTLSNIENGKAYPTFITICNLIAKGGIEPNYLFGFINKNTKKGKIIDVDIMELLIGMDDDTKEHVKHILKTMARK